MTKVINAFPGYEFVWSDDDKKYHNMYRGVDVSFGGYVYSKPGMYGNVALLDVQSLHPNSAVAMNAFGEYTQHFKDILDARIAIKHKDFDKARKMLNGRLAPYLKDESTAKDLAQALKIAINSVYGLTSAGFPNAFKDPRNKNNIVALRGALFMKTLQDEVTAKGYEVIHIKTDSIKIADADQDIIDFCMEFGKKYGYVFEHEATYDRICLIDKANYVAKTKDGEWTVTGDAFAHPYIFKTLFDKMPIEFYDLCELKSVQKGAIYLDKNEDLPDISIYEIELDKRKRGVKRLNKDLENYSDEDLKKAISQGHNYVFIGRVGEFCPVTSGGGELVCINGEKINAVNGTKGYRWMESLMVKELGKENDIDMSYYNKLVDDAIETISKFGDFEWFVSDEPYIPKSFHSENIIKSDPLPASFELTDSEMAMDIGVDYQNYY